MMTFTLEVPEGAVQTGGDRRQKLERAALALFDAELLTQGQAAQMVGLSRVEFFDLLGKHNISPFQYDWDDAQRDALRMTGAEGLGSQ